MLKSWMKQLWQDEAGFVVSSELVLIATILVIGIIAGQTAIRDAVVGELADVSAAIGGVNQSYSFGAITGHCASTAGSIYVDLPDFCEADAQVAGQPDHCISICIVAATEEQ